jgi:predicted metal-dependent hydrolase
LHLKKNGMLNFLNELFANEKPKKQKNTDGTSRENREGGQKPKTRAKPLPENTVWTVNDQPIPVEIHRERRQSWRYAFAKGGKLIVRLPKVDKATDAKIISAVKNALTERATKKPEMLQFFDTKTYRDGDTLQVNKRIYALKITFEDRKTHAAKLLKNGWIEMKLAAADTEGGQQKAISTLLSRTIANDNAAEFIRRVNELNFQYFKKPIKSVNFKYNHSNWGSCSRDTNLNFSSRLLFAPDDVQDYVIIHELAHLVELNHSDRFWKLVSDAMPNYMEKEKWLKKNSHQCRF